MGNQEHSPAIDDRDVRLFVLTNNTKTISFEIHSHGRSTSESGVRLRRSWGIHGGLLFGRGWDNEGRDHILRASSGYRLGDIVRACQNFRTLSKAGIRGGFRGDIECLRF
jgi:hypothetical protein